MPARALISPAQRAVMTRQDAIARENLSVATQGIEDAMHDDETILPAWHDTADRLSRGIQLSLSNGATTFTSGYCKDAKGGIVEKPLTVLLKPTGLTGQKGLVVTVIYTVGAVTMTKTVTLTSTAARFIEVSASQVTIGIASASSNGAPATAGCKVAVLDGHGKAASFYGNGYAVLDAATFGQVVTGEGVLGWAAAILEGLGGATAPLFVQLFDGTSAPTGGTAPMLTLPGKLATAGDAIIFSLEQDYPGAISWSSGLLATLSTTAGTFTSPSPNTPTMNLQVRFGT